MPTNLTYEQEFLKDFEDFINQQIPLMEVAMKMAEAEKQKEAAIRYESRLDAYQFLQGKFANYRAGKDFHDMPDLGKKEY